MLSNTILSAAEATIPNKFVTIRKQDPAWLTNEIRKLIRKKNRIHNKAKRLNKPKSPWLYSQILRLNDLLTGLGAFKKPMTGQWQRT
jgi:hypothetical protein